MRLPARSNSFYQLMAPHRLPLWAGLGILFVYLIIPGEAFWSNWGIAKIGEPSDIALFTGYLLLFGIGSALGAATGRRWESLPTRRGGIPRWYLWAGLLASLCAYLLWFGLGIMRAGGIGALFAFRSVDPYYVRAVLMETVPGLTTFTQVAVVAIPLMLVTIDLGPWERRVTLLIVGLGLARSYFYMERLALLELAIPSVFILLSRRPNLRMRTLVGWLLASVAGVLLFFTIQEGSRSFLYNQVSGTGNLLMAGGFRFAGYYVTSLNTGFLVLQEWALDLPFYSAFRWIWGFPGLEGLYQSLTDAVPRHLPTELAIRGLNPEYNTATGIASWVSDFGHYGAILWAFGFGLLSGALWRHAPRSGFAAALYGVWLVGLLELMRIPYLSDTRLVPAYLFLGFAVLLDRRPSRRPTYVADRE